jgi:hypothetical protein
MSIGGFWGGGFEGEILGASCELTWECLWVEFKSVVMTHLKIGIQAHEVK